MIQYVLLRETDCKASCVSPQQAAKIHTVGQPLDPKVLFSVR